MISKLDKKLNVKTLQGRVINIYVDPSDKIKSLKSQIQLKETIPLEQQVLLLGNNFNGFSALQFFLRQVFNGCYLIAELARCSAVCFI